MGAGAGLGYNLNVPLDPYANDADIIAAWERQLVPTLDKMTFKPDLVLISAGFDSRMEDYLGNFRVTDAGFVRLTEIAMDLAAHHCNGRLVSLLEGGYNPEGLADAVAEHVRALLEYRA
jgi:acetoin utilization deacetylase AcuC-like enzyme